MPGLKPNTDHHKAPLLFKGSGRPPLDMVDWFTKYINDPEYSALFKNQHSLKLAAEATYWSEQLGLASFFQKMTLKELTEFDPKKDIYATTERSALIKQVIAQLKSPTSSLEIIFALRDAAWSIHYKQNFGGAGPQIPKDMVAWFQGYLNDPGLTLPIKKRTLELIAEATYWSERYGLASYFRNMIPEKLKAFDPNVRIHSETELGCLLRKVAMELKKPNTPEECCLALKETAMAVHIRYSDVDQYKKEIGRFTSVPARPKL